MKSPAQDVETIPIIHGVAALNTNVDEIPHTPIISSSKIEDTTDISNDYDISIDYLVGDIEQLDRERNDKTIRLLEDGSLFFESPIALGKTARMKLRIDEEHASIQVNPIYHKLGAVTIDKLYSPGWHFTDVLNILLLRNGYTLLHCAAFEYNTDGIVLIGLSNTGKTTTTMEFVTNKGAKYLAEDVAATNGNEIFRCPYSLSPINPELTNNISHRVYDNLTEYLPLIDHIWNGPIKTISDIIPENKIGDRCSVSQVIKLTRDSSNTSHSFDGKSAVNEIIASNRSEFTYLNNPVLLAAKYHGMVDDLFSLGEKEEKIIETLITNQSKELRGDPEFFKTRISKK